MVSLLQGFLHSVVHHLDGGRLVLLALGDILVHMEDVQRKAQEHQTEDNGKEELLVAARPVGDMVRDPRQPGLLGEVTPCLNFLLVTFPVLGIVLVGHRFALDEVEY